MESKIFQTDTKSLAKLLDPTADSPTLYHGADLGVILRHQLEAPLADELALPICGAEGRAPAPIEPDPSLKTFSDLFHHSNPTIDLLKRAKEFAKSCRTYPELLPAEVATLLYYAAITAARVHAGEKITEMDDAGLKKGLEWAIAQPWVDGKTRELFQKGLETLL